MELKPVGAITNESGTEFRVWAPFAKRVEVLLPEAHELKNEDRGYFSLDIKNVGAGARYKFRIDGKEELPDPASRFQPDGPHGVSQVIAKDFSWQDQQWKGVPLKELVIYELHVGTFTEEGTFKAILKHLPRLRELGVNAIELMPIAQFPGKKNWGYDGVGLFAPQNSYAHAEAPLELKEFINTCHLEGIAVILDVVYNHFGPEGNYLPKWGPYFQDKYKTPWGPAVNFDGPHSDDVRNFFYQNVRQWLEEYHFDGLRMDAVHAILDVSATPFLGEVTELAHQIGQKQGREVHVIAESESNDPRILMPVQQGGLGFDAHWADDLHHVIHSYLTGEKQGYYADYGDRSQITEVFKSGILFQGQYSPARFRSHGRSYKGVSRTRLVVCTQNHDQIGNRRDGERLSSLTSLEKLKAGIAWSFLSGGLPLIFMGEELGEKNPFLYFVDHTDAELLQAVREGRKKEFASWEGEAPDPASDETFARSRPRWEKLNSDKEAQEIFSIYKKLIRLSRDLRKENFYDDESLRVENMADGKIMHVQGVFKGNPLNMFISLVEEPMQISVRHVPKDVLFQLGDCVIEDRVLRLSPYGLVVLQ